MSGGSARSGPTGEEEVTTPSGIPVRPLYDADDVSAAPDDPGRPGEYPFTRGIHPTMYRGRLWTMRQYAGFGTAAETNRRYRYLLERGQTGLSVAFDLPTQMGYDSDAAMAAGEVGRVGVAIDSIDDMRTLLEDIRLDQVSTSMTINSTAAILLALYIAVAEEQGVDRSELRGTIQNDILKEYIARGTYIYPVGPSLRLISDVVSFCASEVPQWNPISISGYHIREAGSTAPQEVAFTFANGITYVERALAAGIPLEDFAPRLSFFFAAHNDVLEEVAKFRAARRLWAHLMRERFGASDRSCRLRFHTQTGGSTLTAQQPLNNTVRVTIQALSAVLGGTQSLHTNAYDEALALPTEESARIALRTQQVIAHESGVTRTVDPLAGSYYVETLTDEIEKAARTYLEEIDERGGAESAIDFMQQEIDRSAYRHQLDVEEGRTIVVGVNAFDEEEDVVDIPAPDFGHLERAQSQRVRTFRAGRDEAAARGGLESVAEAAGSSENLMPPIIAAVKAGATVGEISDALRRQWGTYDR